jgi:glycosyltransferase involved in cell wall biosynthesis
VTGVSIVIPVRDGAGLLAACLDRVVAEADGAAVVVVDDGSSDGSAKIAEQRGATVIRQGGGGPYRARNAGWQSTDTDLVVFTDVRCRPHPGWLQGLVAAMKDDGVAIAGGDVVAQSGPRVAQRYVAKHQPLAPVHGLNHPVRPYLPTCNIVTRRSVLLGVDGFREIRSGGDLDFSWRAQLAGLGRVAFAPGAGVDWVPRETVREVRRQWYRYGAAKPALWQSYRDQGLDATPPPDVLRFIKSQGLQVWRDIRADGLRQADVAVLGVLCQWSFRRGYLEQQRAISAGG